MPAIRPSRDIRPLSAFRAHAAEIIRHVRETRRPVVLTQRGHGAAVLLDVEEYERMIEELDLLRDVRAAERELEAGGGLSHEDALAEALARVRR